MLQRQIYVWPLLWMTSGTFLPAPLFFIVFGHQKKESVIMIDEIPYLDESSDFREYILFKEKELVLN